MNSIDPSPHSSRRSRPTRFVASARGRQWADGDMRFGASITSGVEGRDTVADRGDTFQESPDDSDTVGHAGPGL